MLRALASRPLVSTTSISRLAASMLPSTRTSIGETGTVAIDDACPAEEVVGATADASQVHLMKEQCIVVDEEDRVVRPGSKLECHLNSNIKQGLLHRAFSVFLFNSEGQLLLQKRSAKKITFPEQWANTCCSHPLHYEAEMEATDQLGVKRAALRKLDHELGVREGQLAVTDFTFITRILYQAPYDDKWGEYEVDYILFAQRDVAVAPNPEEVESCRYFTKAEVQALLRDMESGLPVEYVLTPWFHRIAKTKLFQWWDSLHELHTVQDPHSILRL